MIELHDRFFVGDDYDAERLMLMNAKNLAILHCCKEPWHRQMLGYLGRSAPAGHPEYLFALRDARLALNMVDVEDPNYFAPEMIKAGLAFMNYMYRLGYSVLCHCNRGESRGPSMAMLFMASRLGALPDNFTDAELKFMAMYPNYNPKNGIRTHIIRNWDEYVKIERPKEPPNRDISGFPENMWYFLRDG